MTNTIKCPYGTSVKDLEREHLERARKLQGKGFYNINQNLYSPISENQRREMRAYLENLIKSAMDEKEGQ